jgi:hypothetical protein
LEQHSLSLAHWTPRVRQQTPPTQSASPLLKSQQSSRAVQACPSAKHTGFRSRHRRAVAQFSRHVFSENCESQPARSALLAALRLESMRCLQVEGPPFE